MSNKEKTFKDWTVDNLRFELGLIEKDNCKFLTDWLKLSEEATIEDWQKLLLDRLLKKAAKFFDTWNESDLQNKFISPITELVDFDNVEHYFASFTERKLETSYKFRGVNVPLKGKVDWMVAIGKSDPHVPYFFIHEYKRQHKNASSDPKGQLLATMLAAHVLNQNKNADNLTLFSSDTGTLGFPKYDKNIPLYGCYIVGRWWFFTVLHNGTYCVSSPYDSINKAKLFEIIGILKRQKEMIIKRLVASYKSNLN